MDGWGNGEENIEGEFKKCWPLLLSCKAFDKIKSTITQKTENVFNIMSTEAYYLGRIFEINCSFSAAYDKI